MSSGIIDMIVDLIESIQSFSLMIYHAARYSLTNFRSREVLIQMDRIGVGSVPIVFLASLFAGLDMALQFEVVMAPYGAKALLGKVVATSIVRDMGPVMASLVMSARVTSGIASEVGMMQATSQIEALSVMGVDPIDQIVAPRILSGIVMMPILSVIGDFLGILGGLVIAFLAAHIPVPLYWSGVREALTLPNIVNGVIKPILFGFILTSVGCFYGMKSGGGAAMVGRTTTRAVVAAAVWILVANFLISKLLLNLWGNEG